MWEAFKMDFKERFLNFETVKGVYMLPAGAVIAYAAVYYIAYVIQVAFGLFGLYLAVEGVRKIAVNRVKQALRNDQLKTTRLAASGEPSVVARTLAPE